MSVPCAARASVNQSGSVLRYIHSDHLRAVSSRLCRCCTTYSVTSNAPQGSEKLYEALSYATPIPSPNKNDIIQKNIEDTYAQILAGNVSVQQGLAQLNQQIQSNLS
jgi:hypothetical protein